MRQQKLSLNRQQRLRAHRQKSRWWQLSHRRHTGKQLPHHATSYPMVLFLLLCTGLIISAWPHLASAAYNDPVTNSYDVTARVPGPPPTQSAVITSPLNGATVTNVPLNVRGTCPDKTYVELYRNDTFSGVALCDASGVFQLQTDLFDGRNDLVAKVFSATDVAGPVASAVAVTYSPPQTTISSGTTTGATGSSRTPATVPLLIAYSFNYRGIYAGQEGTWTIDVSGGTAPYALAIDWGDGKRDVVSAAKAGPVPLTHTYAKQGGYRGSYVISISASDLLGQKTNLQLIAIVADPAGGLSVAPLNGSSQPMQGPTVPQTVLQYVWPIYGLVTLAAVAFWLGEWNELQKLRPVRRHKPRHA